MELPQATPLQKKDATQENAAVKAAAWISMRLWTYGGPFKQLADLTWDEDQSVEELIRSVLGEGGGIIVEHQNILAVSFENAVHAVAIAKTLQQRLLTYQCKLPEQQVVSAVVVQGPGTVHQFTPLTELLVEAHSSQILVTEEIFEPARNLPGFRFKPKPVRGPSETGIAETIYELLWTDESTYSNLRKAGQNTEANLSAAGRYKIEAELGRGAMGVVYKAYDQVIGRTVALKTISVSQSAPSRREFMERLKQEAKAAGCLDHPNIITIYDVGQEGDLVYLSMQFIEGKTLSELLTDGPLPALPTLISYAEQVCSAVEYAHKKGVIHRDLKPANFMITEHGMVKVLDFGIAKLEDATLTQPGMVVGTPTYMAPEQAKGIKIDHRADIFALGSVFYELFTREKPFKGDVTTILYKIIYEDPVAPALINPALPGGIDALIRTALAKDPKNRFQSCEEMQHAFHEQGALLKSTTTVRSASPAVAVAAAAKPQTQPASSGAHYLLEETVTVRPYRRKWLGMTMLMLVVAVAGFAGWTYYVKSQTGSFPPMVQKVMAAVHPETHESPAAKPAAETAKPSLETAASPAPVAASSPENLKPSASADNSAAASPAAASSPEAGTAQKPADKEGETEKIPQATAAPDTEESKPATKPAAKPHESTPASVDGFTRRDIPDLLRQAEAAIGRGEYPMARYEYNLILKLDHNNEAAKAGLKRAH